MKIATQFLVYSRLIWRLIKNIENMARNKNRYSDNDSKAKLETDTESDVDKQIDLETAIESVDDFEVKDL